MLTILAIWLAVSLPFAIILGKWLKGRSVENNSQVIRDRLARDARARGEA